MGLVTAGRTRLGMLGRVLRIGGLAAMAAALLTGVLAFSAGPAPAFSAAPVPAFDHGPPPIPECPPCEGA
jgi:hypothetical protein